jgi:hypothetical protein
VAKPRNAHSLTHPQAGHAASHGIDSTDNFMTGNPRQLRIRQFSVDYMQIGAAYAACRDFYPNLSWSGQSIGQFCPHKRLMQLA